MPRFFVTSVIVAAGLGNAVALAVAAETPPPPEIRLDVKQHADRAVVKIDGDRATIEITSPRGIGRMEVTLQKGRWPREIVLRIGVKGMEGFFADNGQWAFQGRLGEDQAEVYRIEKDGKRTAAPNDGKYRIRIRREGRAIEVVLPPQLHEDGVRSFRVQWIDFYRG